MSTIIRTRSPFFIRTPQQTSSSLNYFQINITVFGGLSNSSSICDDLYAAYSLQKKPLGAEDSVTVDISEIVNDHIEQIFTGTYSASSEKSSIWVTVSTSARESDGTLIGVISSNTYLAQEGYNKFKDGVNYTTEPTAMISGTYLEYHKGTRVTIPVNVERVTRVEFYDSNGTLLQQDNYSDNGNQNQKIQYSQYAETQEDLTKAVIYYDSIFITINLKGIEECKYPVNKITFLNRWGAMQDLFFFKKSTESLELRSENFNKSIFQARRENIDPGPRPEDPCRITTEYNLYSTTAHSKKTFNANATESVVLNTGFVNELMNPYFEELMVSEYIWLTDLSANIYPVNLKESSFAKKTGLNDRLINYTMSFEKSFSLVNNIR